ncbi:hypothetical protein DTO166G4_7757 [Paecilomyces variotii]|nr:hypothetical protein DTO166G4_7757 [Paecilomyces variotii]KAJ9232072.1 hypothetical protein DTO166G5_6400 [Paecilomyces variotii]
MTVSPSTRQAREMVLNTIIEDMQVTPSATQVPVSTGSSSSNYERKRQVRHFDDLYDATDSETEYGDGCPSRHKSRPAKHAVSLVRGPVSAVGSRNRYPRLSIPPVIMGSAMESRHKKSSVPPTPPTKIPVSPAVLSMLPQSVPALHAPPSLDGSSVSSDQISNNSTPVTPEIHAAPESQWNSQHVRVDSDPDMAQNTAPTNVSNPDVNIAIEGRQEDWERVIASFPHIPRAVGNTVSESVNIIIDGPIARTESPSESGVTLPEDAMATLRHIPLDITPDPWSETSENNDEMWQLSGPSSRPRSADDTTPASNLSGYSFTNLSIPSPGGFFSSLGPRARHTWSFPKWNNTPTSDMAEYFYIDQRNEGGGEIVEQIIECGERVSADDQPTARQSAYNPPTAIRIPSDATPERSDSYDGPLSPGIQSVQEILKSDRTYEYDESYEEELKKRALANLDRTSVWLAAQTSYLAALRDTNPVNEVNEEAAKVHTDNDALSSPDAAPKKSVRFAEAAADTTIPPPPSSANKDSIYWKGFKSVLSRTRHLDAFIHGNARFDAVQSVRLGLPDRHIDGLMGKYELIAHERPPYKGPFSQAPRNSVLETVLAEKAQFARIEKEQTILFQLCQSMWAMDALRYLNGGSLISSPASKRLSKATANLGSPESAGKRRIRVLDLGGQSDCEWAWHLANDYRNVKIYTVVTKQQAVNNGIKGPANHRTVSVPYLWKLPFRDNQFDIISARSLHALLRTESPMGETMDEYDLCLKECYRCLKPGGYLEFFVMDAEITRAGPYASATSIEFSFNLKTRGYDPKATKSFLTRLRRGAFTDIKRAWMFLPMGVEPTKPEPPRETPEPRIPSQVLEQEAVQGPVGSTADIASMTGLLGGWMWEKWLLKLQMEMGRGRERALEGIGSVFDEGRKNGAGWTCLCGWAMKPKRLREAEVAVTR